MKGQAFTVPHMSALKQVTIPSCCSSPVQFAIRKAPQGLGCNPNIWNTGEVIYSSNTIQNICQLDQNCSQANGYVNRYWQPPSVLLMPDQEYVIELTQGYSIGACSSGNLPGTGFNSYGEVGATMLFELELCTDLNNWGCGDPEATNWAHQATFHHPSFCIYEDCNGTTGGGAVIIPDCGCVDPNDPQQLIQCPDGPNASLISNDGDACPSRLFGQTWTAPENGYLTGMQCMADSTETIELNVVIHDGPMSDSTLHTVIDEGVSGGPCQSEGDRWRTIHFDSIPIQQGRQYRFEFAQGSAASSCNAGYPLGYGLDQGFTTSNKDMLFRIAHQPDHGSEMNWACLDPSACNYDQTGTHDSGICHAIDCNGDCNGTAILVEGCGCREGLTGIPASSCTGCTNPDACNYSTVEVDGTLYPPLIDDGSCVVSDCNNDCGGYAFESPTCGCIGGNTGIDPAGCLALCQSTVSISEFGQATFYGSIAAQGSIQSFTLPDDLFVTGIRLVQLFAPTEPFTIRIRQGDNPYSPTSSSVVSVFDNPNFTQATHFGMTTYQLLFTMDIPIDVQPDEYLFIELHDGNWASPKNPFDSYPFGASFTNENSSQGLNDMAFEVITCTEIYGCTDPNACNYEPWATDLEPESCWAYCTDPAAQNYTPEEDADGSCIDNRYCQFNLGCKDVSGCNFDAGAMADVHPHDPTQVAPCTYPEPYTCQVCSGETDGTGSILDGDTDGDGVCDVDEIVGCQVEAACNYNEDATDAGNCVYPNACVTCVGSNIDGSGFILTGPDSDGDGLCDDLDFCSDPLAGNYDANPSETCVFECDELPDQLKLTALTFEEIPTGSETENGWLGLQYEGGHGNHLVWTLTVVDLLRNETLSFELQGSIGPLRSSLYSIHITDGYGCRGILMEDIESGGPDLIHRPSSPQAIPFEFESIQPVDPTQLRVAIPFTSCE